MKLDFDCIIIGAGVAGMTSAIYLKRSGINVAIIEKNYVGGQINKTYTIKNYPGFKEIDGPTLAVTISEKLQELEVPIIYEEVTNIIDNGKYKEIETKKQKYISQAVIIASGKKERHLNLEGEKELIGHGISWCATCDGNFFKGQNVAVVGGGNTAMEDALYLSNICNKVYVINRSNNFRADTILLEQAKNKQNIEIMNILSPILKGDIGERYITKHLKRNGYKILCKNMRNSCSEIDIIACKDDVIAFVEVKTRTAGQKIPAVYAVDNKKQKKIK